jgi:hypothetical protein
MNITPPKRKIAAAAILVATGILTILLLAFSKWQRVQDTSTATAPAENSPLLEDSRNPGESSSGQPSQGQQDSSPPELNGSGARMDPANFGLNPNRHDSNSPSYPALNRPSRSQKALGSSESSSSAARSDPIADRERETLDSLILLTYGNRAYSTDQIKASIRLPGHPTPASVEQSVREQVLEFYKARGFVQAQVSKANAIGFSPWTVEVEIEEGDSFVLGWLEIEGVSALSPDEVLEFYPQVGAIVDWPGLERADSQLRSRYRDLGYLNVKIKPRAGTMPAKGEFFYKIRVEEGPLYRVRSITVPTSLASTFPFQSGDPFRESLLDQFVMNSKVSKDSVLVDRFDRQGIVDIVVGAEH